MPPSLSGYRFLSYSALSTVLVSAVIASAFHKHSNFYSATVFLSRSNASVMVLANYGVLLTLLFGRLVQRIFFGPLTNQEVERLYDRTWYFLTESLLAFTIFRDEFDAPFVIMFGVLLFLKCFHWLIADRIDWMDQQPYPGPSWLFHIRTNVMFFILWTIDILMLDFAVESVLAHGVGGIVLFGSEYAILLATCFNSMMKYVIMVYDLRRARGRGGEDAPVWENKSMYMFYVELVTDFLKLTTYLTFFTIVMMFFGLPLNIIRDVYMTGVSFYTRFRDLLRYRAATKDMETKYPDASPAELEAMSDRTCIICREEMVVLSRIHAQPLEVALGPNGLPQPGQTLGFNDPPKKLHCGHVFHFQCLRSWLERQQSCPTCRRSVLEGNDAPSENDVEAARRRGAGQGGNPAQNPGADLQNPNEPVAPAPNAPNQRQQFAAGLMNLAFGVGGTPNPPPAVRPRPAQAIPRAFQGFSVQGVWHPWDGPPLTTNEAPTPAAQPSLEASRANDIRVAPGSPGGSSTGTLTPTLTTEENVSSGHTPEPSIASEVLSPREAAAVAALRRLGRDSKTSNPSPSSVSAPTLIQPPTVNNSSQSVPSVAVAEGPAPSASISSPLSSTNSLSGSSSSTTPTPTKKVAIPTLIPLFDPTSVAHRPFINLNGLTTFAERPSAVHTPLLSPPSGMGLQTPATMNGVGPSSFPFFSSGGYSMNGTPTRTPAWTPAMSPSLAPSRVQSSLNLSAMFSAAMKETTQAKSAAAEALAPPSLPTPSALTDEAQLRRLDSWTREAIDERLRVLEGVQQSLWRAAEDLQRVRSALHPLSVPLTSVSADDGASMEMPPRATSDIKGKGKARAVEDITPPPPPTPRTVEFDEAHPASSETQFLLDPGMDDVLQR